ncbi:MAG: hypothetical protein ACYTGZ_14485 [Planctomycetota bacterium]|jgi:hypothetical protein
MRRTVPPFALVLIAACTTTPTTVEYLRKQQGYHLVQGYIISIKVSSPKVERLKDGVAYTVTDDSTTVLMEFDARERGSMRKRRESYELSKGDVFVKSRPYSYLLIRKK